jgi:hypothetical protein
MIQPILNTAGIIFSIIGVVILFYYGFPQPSFQEYVGLAIEDNTIVDADNGITAKNIAEESALEKREYKSKAMFALFLILTGFVFQIVATWWNKIIQYYIG